ncbi:FTFMHR domain-containing protein [Aspergillus homomorphus CBS 101889]|uniref:C2H2-type domain-containing protein n=1 Tax=Aspergillus homomorphus (strain CBS 101889) TaxID=1450537 RepID=A0A395HJU1_ASPHC|nr:hypothetical protein BO97DRAFT_398947 [Aspergillus homomorphus CBS 101889]RAL08040.1 hypothetical protein BO97DRAFT_398947 [Aspergillus homomorphus CBS 101889]
MGRQKGIRGTRRNEPPLICNFCWRGFTRREHLTRHLRVHTQERPFTCDTCGKEFSRMDILNRHTKVHDQQRPEMIINRTQRRAACLQCATSRETRTRSLEPIAILGDNADWAQDSLLSDTRVYDARAGNSLDSEIPYEPGMDGVPPRDELASRSLSAINWLSPDETILQEWASQLAGIPDGGIFPTGLALPDVPPLPQLLSTQPTVEWAPASQSATDHAQMETPAEMMSCPERAATESSGKPMDEQSSQSSRTTSGKYYVHGIAWRAPFQTRFRKGQAMSPVDRGSVTTSAPSSVSIGSVANLDGTTSSLSKWLAEDVYARIVRGVEEETQASSCLPSLPAIRLCVHLYFERLHPNFPFLSQTAFVSEKPHWILSLAVAGVGAVYLRSSQGSQWKDTLMQAVECILARRLHQVQRQVNTTPSATNAFETANQVEDVLPLVQAKVLHLLCMLHSSMSYISQRAVFERADLVQWCSFLNLIPDSVGVSGLSTRRKDIHQWITEQSSLRTGMMIWLLDSMMAYELNCNHLMKLGDLRGLLPCHETAWERPSLENIAFAESFSVSLLEALDLIYIEKRLPPQLSQFSQTLLIHAIYQRTTEIADQSRMRLSSWSPTDSVQITTSGPASAQAMWPPSSSLFVKWRNAACDSLDVLHCTANSRAAESCWEEPTILYLHLARLILLSPFVHFQTLAQDPLLPAQGGLSAHTSHQERFEHARSQVFQWAIQDQFKARLAVIHAGALLWHVRRFSTDNVIEPFSVYIATLLLWAYSLSAQSVRVQSNTSHQSGTGNHLPSLDQLPDDQALADEDDAATDQSDAEPRLIYLDRPLDDELVQMYIRVGNKVSAQLKGVGDITSDGAPVKILRQGFYLLAGKRYVRRDSPNSTTGERIVHTWGIQRLYAATIRCLIEAS